MLESVKILYNNGMLRKILEYYIGCIGTKTVIIHMINHDSPIFIYYFGVAYIFIAVRFMYLFFFDTTEMPLTTKSNFAIESKLWLNKFRLIHSAIYFTFSFFVLRGYTVGCWKILVVDIIFGTTTYTVCLIKKNPWLSREQPFVELPLAIPSIPPEVVFSHSQDAIIASSMQDTSLDLSYDK